MFTINSWVYCAAILVLDVMGYALLRIQKDPKLSLDESLNWVSQFVNLALIINGTLIAAYLLSGHFGSSFVLFILVALGFGYELFLKFAKKKA